MKIDSVVVLYNPEEIILKNILSYISFIDKLYIVDNSDVKKYDLIEKIVAVSPKCNYVDNYGNKGIAHALNVGVKLAIENGADWLLTMDQDSSFNNNDLQKIIEELHAINDNEIAILSPSHYKDEQKLNPFYNTITMTSGNFINLDILHKIGSFDENLFIDSVDTEFCLRIYANNYKIKRLPLIILEHNLGEIRKYNFLGLKFSPTNHNKIRRYYIIRNRFYVWEKYKNIYPDFIKWEKLATLKEIIKIILFEKDKLSKIRFSIKGYLDFKKNKFGKYKNAN